MWDMEALSAQLSMGQLDALKTVLLDQVAKVDEAKVKPQHKKKEERRRHLFFVFCL